MAWALRVDTVHLYPDRGSQKNNTAIGIRFADGPAATHQGSAPGIVSATRFRANCFKGSPLVGYGSYDQPGHHSLAITSQTVV